MKIAIRGGHNPSAPGAVGYLNELTEDRKVYPEVIKFLQTEGHTVYDVTPSPCDANSDLYYGVNRANALNVDLFVSIHFNAAAATSANGVEVCIYSGSDSITLDDQVASRICKKVSELGFYNRGVKVRGADLCEIRETKMASCIVECCFVTNKGDSDLYKKVGHKEMAKKIAEGILNKSIGSSNNDEGEEEMAILCKEQVFKGYTKAVRDKYCYALVSQYCYDENGKAIKLNGKEYTIKAGTKLKMYSVLGDGNTISCYVPAELKSTGINGIHVYLKTSWDGDRIGIPEMLGEKPTIEKIVEKEVIKEVIKEVVVEKPVEIVKEVLVPQPIMVVTGQDQKQLEKVKESLVIDYNCEIVVPKK